MKLVVDTNVLLSALIKKSTSRYILLNPNHTFYIPESAIEEVQKYFNTIHLKSGLSTNEIKFLFDLLTSNFQIIPLSDFLQCYEGAKKVMQHIDEKDTPFVALANCIECDGIWSNDKDLKKQDLVRVWNTEEIVTVIN